MSGISVATIKSPEFINITSINPLISKCEIKVLYIGQNRNRSFISKEVAKEMAQTLPGTPIVGAYSERQEDFTDHGDQMVIDGDGIKFNCLTKPYGFVPIDSKIWFKEFQDTDEMGNSVIREYLMCEGYLWTEQYKEAQRVINEGRPHSMELDEATLKGHWSTDNNRGIDFFIINDAIFSKLCILGNKTEPCFEGSSVTAPEVSSSFSFVGNEFTLTLYTMMQQLKELTYSLKEQGGSSMSAENMEVQTTEPVVEEIATSSVVEENFTAEQGNSEQQTIAENQNNVEEFTKNNDKNEEEKPDDSGNGNDAEQEEEDKNKKPTKNELEAEDKYAILEQKFNELNDKYAALEQQNKELLDFKLESENKEKDALIAQFYMLSDEDKKDVIENKSKYSLDDIEAKLSVICVRKKVSFDNNQSEAEQKPAVTFDINSAGSDDLPAWLKAVENQKNRN